MRKLLSTSWEKTRGFDLSDKGTAHSYIEVYDYLFRKKKTVNLLEIGVQRGGSLMMWADFFSNKSNIIGIDYKLSKIKNEVPLPENVKCYEGDSYSLEMVKQVSDLQYDIFIDDGSHKINDMVFCIKNYLPLMKEDGIFIIEDIKTKHLQYIDHLYNALPKEMRSKAFVIDRRGVKGRQDDMLFVVNKEMK